MNGNVGVSMQHVVGIVGGAGFIGLSLASYLNKNYRVKLLDVRRPESLPHNVIFEKCDIRYYNLVRKCLRNVDVVVNTAIIQIPAINEYKRLGYEVNFLGTHNVCRAVDELKRPKGLILAGSWHVFGERELKGVIDEEFGFRPDKVEDRARLYVLSKIAQEVIVRYFKEMSDKDYAVIRMGTVLGEGMPEKTAANIFITRGLRGEPITPYRHSMHRPMLYVDVNDVVMSYESLIEKMLSGKNTLPAVNLFYPEPITVLELAEIVKDVITELTSGRIMPKIEVVDKGIPPLFTPEDKNKFSVDISKSLKALGIDSLTHPRESVRRIVKVRLETMQNA